MRFTQASHHLSSTTVQPYGDSGKLAIGADKSRRIVIRALSPEKTDASRELAEGEVTMNDTRQHRGLKPSSGLRLYADGDEQAGNR